MSFAKSISDTLGTTEVVVPCDRDLDWAIVQKVQAGDVKAFDKLIQKYRERLLSIIYNLTSNHEDAADLSQEVFIKAFRSINRFRGKSAFFTWLYRIAVNTTYTYLRKNRFKRYFSLQNIDDESLSSSEVLEHLSTQSSSGKYSLISELQEKLNEALQTLSIKHRTVVILFEIEGLSHQEIAQVTNTSEGTVRSRLHYAKQQLQAYLQDYLN